MLNELIKEYQPKGLKVVGVNLDDEGDLILTRRFIARYKPAFPNFRKKAGGKTRSFRQCFRMERRDSRIVFLRARRTTDRPSARRKRPRDV